MSFNKSQGQSFTRCGLWNWDSQPFSDGMFYTGCSRSTSAAGLKIFSSLGDLTVNKVDFQLLGVRPRATQAPPPPPMVPEPMDTTPPPDERPTRQPSDAGEPMEVDPLPEPLLEVPAPPHDSLPVEDERAAAQPEQPHGEPETPIATQPPPPPQQPPNQNPPNPPTGGAPTGSFTRRYMRL
jgi:hypothetical protein